MFIDFLFGALVCFFSVYGFVMLFINIRSYIDDKSILKDKTVYTVIAVKNEENSIERVVDSLLMKLLKDDNGAYRNRLAVIDLGSEDNTLGILKKMEEDRQPLFVYDMDDFMREMLKKH
ncbi:MAG: glycosyltransferase [Ruminococcaceae bacterium]|nr:glycosyltransferase [Oscillospiraceae bacterium]